MLRRREKTKNLVLMKEPVIRAWPKALCRRAFLSSVFEDIVARSDCSNSRRFSSCCRFFFLSLLISEDVHGVGNCTSVTNALYIYSRSPIVTAQADREKYPLADCRAATQPDWGTDAFNITFHILSSYSTCERWTDRCKIIGESTNRGIWCSNQVSLS